MKAPTVSLMGRKNRTFQKIKLQKKEQEIHVHVSLQADVF